MAPGGWCCGLSCGPLERLPSETSSGGLEGPPEDPYGADDGQYAPPAGPEGAPAGPDDGRALLPGEGNDTPDALGVPVALCIPRLSDGGTLCAELTTTARGLTEDAPPRNPWGAVSMRFLLGVGRDDGRDDSGRRAARSEMLTNALRWVVDGDVADQPLPRQKAGPGGTKGVCI